MVAFGKCPGCNAIVSNVRVEGIDGKENVFSSEAWRCVSYCCPNCNTILGVQIDPVALKTDTIGELFAKLRG
jgi:hypothetical protein